MQAGCTSRGVSLPHFHALFDIGAISALLCFCTRSIAPATRADLIFRAYKELCPRRMTGDTVEFW